MPFALRRDAMRFAEFVAKNYKDANQWPDLLGMMAWYIGHGFAAVVVDESGEIVALGSGRPVDRPGMGCLPYYFNAGGTCLHIDLLIDKSEDERACLALRGICQALFPQCKTVTMFRHYEGKLHVYPIAKFWRSFEKIRGAKRMKEKRYAESTNN
jgi:hypothetical protein